MKRLVSGIVLMLLLMAMFSLALNIKSTKAEWTGTVYIRADGSIYPPDAPIISYDNITYTLYDSIYTSSGHGIVVERDNIIIDGMNHSLLGLGGSNGIYIYGRTNVTIKNIQISCFYIGIDAEQSSYITLLGNNITNNFEAGVLIRGSYNIVHKNYIAINRWGLDIGGSHNNISENTITANQGGSILWDAHNNVSQNVFINDGLRFLYTFDNIVVGNSVNGKPLIYLEGVSDLTVSGEAGQVILINSNNVTIKDLELLNTAVGIELWSTTNSKIYKNRISNNSIGIDVWGSNNHIFENNITNNAFGILFGYGSSHSKVYRNNIINNGDVMLYANSGGISGTLQYNDIFENYFSENVYGINLFYSYAHHNNISQNTFVNDGLRLSPNVFDNVIVDNNVNSKPLVYLEGVSELTVSGEAGQVILVNCSNVNVQNLCLSLTTIGIQVIRTTNSKILNNIITNNRIGVELLQSSYNEILRNNITNNKPTYHGVLFDGYGIHLYESSYNNVSENIIENNTEGVFLFWGSSYNNLYKNIVANNLIDGINLNRFSLCNNVCRNNLTANFQGIAFYESHNNVYENTIAYNTEGLRIWSLDNSIIGNSLLNNRFGICLGASNNYIYHNNFINNIQQVCVDVAGCSNFWDDGYPSGGNYWSDYHGVDLYSGPYQNETGSDGIGDTPYVIDENNVDHYPLMNPWTPKPPVITATVDIQPQTLNLRSRGKWITTYIELPEGYNVADINVSTIMLNDTVPVEPKPIAIGDYDNDTIPDLMVKFDRQQVINYIMANVDISRLYEERFMAITLTVTGKLNDGTPFQGSDIIKIILPMPRGLYKIFPI